MWKAQQADLATGIGIKAIDAGYKVLFTTALALVEALELVLRGRQCSRANRGPAHSSFTHLYAGIVPQKKLIWQYLSNVYLEQPNQLSSYSVASTERI